MHVTQSTVRRIERTLEEAWSSDREPRRIRRRRRPNNFNAFKCPLFTRLGCIVFFWRYVVTQAVKSENARNKFEI